MKSLDKKPGLNHSKMLIAADNCKKAMLSTTNMRIQVNALTGHCRLNKHLMTRGIG